VQTLAPSDADIRRIFNSIPAGSGFRAQEHATWFRLQPTWSTQDLARLHHLWNISSQHATTAHGIPVNAAAPCRPALVLEQQQKWTTYWLWLLQLHDWRCARCHEGFTTASIGGGDGYLELHHIRNPPMTITGLTTATRGQQANEQPRKYPSRILAASPELVVKGIDSGSQQVLALELPNCVPVHGKGQADGQ
jgi:hypothetical protein